MLFHISYPVNLVHLKYLNSSQLIIAIDSIYRSWVLKCQAPKICKVMNWSILYSERRYASRILARQRLGHSLLSNDKKPCQEQDAVISNSSFNTSTAPMRFSSWITISAFSRASKKYIALLVSTAIPFFSAAKY